MAKGNKNNSKLPFVFSNFAMTADGKIAFADRTFIPFGSERDREHMMELRATADAVMAGARTIETGGVTLGTGGKKFERLRQSRGLSKYHLRVIVSGNGSIPPEAEIFKHHFSPIIILVSGAVPEKRMRQLRTVAEDVKRFGQREIDLAAAARWLRNQWGVERLLCEGGGALHASLIRAGLLNEMHVTICPALFGGRTAPTIADGSDNIKLAEAATFRLESVKRVADELFVVLKAAKSGQV